MSQISRNLYIGSLRDAENRDFLFTSGITHIVNLSGFPNSYPEDFEYLKIDIPDEPNQNIARYFPTTDMFIYKAISNGGIVLIHCYAGISRSASVLIAYLSNFYPIEEVFDYVRKRRPIIDPNDGFRRQLYEYNQRTDRPLKRLQLMNKQQTRNDNRQYRR